MDDRFLRLKEVIHITGLSRSTIYAEISKGNFPKQIQLTGSRSVGWLESEIAQWVDSKFYEKR
jgi:prophage regulatory protein